MNELITWQPGMTLDQLEREVILKALKYYKNNKTHTAEGLGIAIRTIDNKLEKYKQEDEAYAELLKKKEEKANGFLQASRGIPVEPVTEPTKEHGVPVREQEKIQEVLPSGNAKGHHAKRIR